MAMSTERASKEAPDSTLKDALESNLTLQSVIDAELKKIAKEKAENRRSAARLSRSSLECKTPASLPPPPAPLNAGSRLWKRLYFVGKDGSTPDPNPDTVRRRELEAKTFLHYLQPPWSAKETKELQAVVKEMSMDKQQVATADNSSTAPTTDDDGIDFVKVAEILKERSTLVAAESTQQPRTAQECRVRYEHNLEPKRVPFSKAESRKISEHVHLHNGYPDWQVVADSLPNNRTAWECLVAYQTKLRPAKHSDWTQQEDQLLLRYVAAAGPQFVVDGGPMIHLAARLMPDRSRKQILIRVNQSILNPNNSHDAWSDDEERLLALCMKVYSNTPNGLYRASMHLKNRSNRSVADKWQRSLNPEYKIRPFTKEEDATLMQVARANPKMGWTELSRQYFRERHPQRLSARWSELANDQDILARSGESLVSKQGSKKRRVDDEARLELDDFVVHIQKK